MREHVSQNKKTTTGFSIPSLKHRIPGFSLESSAISRQAIPKIEPIDKPLTHDISCIPLRRQTKLSISQPGDIYEQEADSVAQQVMQRMAQPVNHQSIEREALPEEEEELQMKSLDNSTLQPEALPEEEEELQMKLMVERQGEAKKASTPDLETSINQARGGGQLMADNIREPMEGAFGADFSRVKVHTDGQSDQLNRSIQARAFTTGLDVFFRQGEYNPGSRGGQELLAHELTHVVQQDGGAVQRELGDKERIIQPMNKTVLQCMQSNSTTTEKEEEGKVSFSEKMNRLVIKDNNGKELIITDSEGIQIVAGLTIKYTVVSSNQFITKVKITDTDQLPPATNEDHVRNQAYEKRTQEVKSKNLIDIAKLVIGGVTGVYGARKHYNDDDAIAKSDPEVKNLILSNLSKLKVVDSPESTKDTFKITIDGNKNIRANIIYTTDEKTSVSSIQVFHVGPSL